MVNMHTSYNEQMYQFKGGTTQNLGGIQSAQRNGKK